MRRFLSHTLVIAIITSCLVVVQTPSAKASVTQNISNCAPSGPTLNSTTGLMVVKFEAISDTSNAECRFVVPDGITSVRVLSVSGGGGGGWDGGGGGGGGGVNKYDNYTVIPGASIVVKVGAGGAAATSSSAAGNGGRSSFDDQYAEGGAVGGNKLTAGGTNTSGSAGGAGHTNNNSTNRAGGVATKAYANINFENDGGSSIGDYAGGGGGAGSAGVNASITASGNGGAGFYSSIEGAGATYGGGGGGGTWKAAVATSGGSGGGGAGGTQDSSGAQGTDGLGGGGGGGGRVDTNRAPGRGGSGVVLVAYRVTNDCTTNSSTSGNYTTVIFSSPTAQINNCRTTWSTPSGVSSAEVLIVAGGGGGGGMFVAGGGGAGGYIYNASLPISGDITIQVGGGGKGGETFTNKTTNIGNQGFDGGNSILQTPTATSTAVGGGGGGSYNVWVNGRAGGSGGGASVGASSPTVGIGGTATSGQGNSGANGFWGGSNPGGGGGGSSSSGSVGSSTGGAGGSGTSNPISGISVSSTSITTLAAGGGGGSDAATSGPGGSSGVGGAGGAVNNSGTDGRANTGSGGGGAGGGSTSDSIKGGNGSAGIVVIRYLNMPTVSGVTISGTAKVGQTLTGSATVTGGGTSAYQWQVSDTSNGTYTDISSATSTTFTLTNTQIGKFIKFKVTQTNSTGSASSTSSATSAVYLYDAPILSSVTVTGTALSGSVITATPSASGEGTITYSYQWYRIITGVGISEISGAMSSSYTLTDSELMGWVYVSVIASNESSSSSAVIGSMPAPPVGLVIGAVTPTISGFLQSGQLLTGATSTTAPAGSTLLYKWLRSDTAAGTYSAISGATNSTYRLTSSDVGKYIKFQVIISNSSYLSNPSNSIATNIVIDRYTISYAAGGGSGSSPVSPTTVINGSTFTLPANTFTRDGYSFAGWSDGTNIYQAGDSYPAATGNISLTATWTASSLTITYDSQGGSSISAGSTTTGGSIASSPGTPTRAGYTFNGWFIASTGGSAITFPYTHSQTASFTLYAQWTASSLTITYDSQGGSSISAGSTTTGGSIASSPGTPTRAGYTFNGWFVASTGGSAITFPYTHSQTASFTLYAQWTASSLTITYDSQGGSSISAGSTTTGGSIATSPGTPTRAGYTFNGWFVASTGGSAITFPYTHSQTASFTLYAQWSLNSSSNEITFSTISSQSYGAVIDLSSSVSASSGLTVALTSSTTAVCTVSSLSVTAIAAGTCTITATQPGNGSYVAATPVERSFTVAKKSLVITVGNLSAVVAGSVSDPSYSQSGLVTAFGDAISTPTYKYQGSGGTYYPISTSKPSKLGSYRISIDSITLSSGSILNYQVTFIAGELTISGVSTNALGAISVKQASGDKTTELLNNFSDATTTYTIYVGADVSAVIATITRPAGSLITAQVKVNNSGWRKLTFQSNISNSGVLPLPSNINSISISTAASDQSVRLFTITIYRDTKSAPTGGSVASPAPTVSPTPAAQVVSAVRFYINNADGIGSGLAVVPMTPTFSRGTNSYTLSFTNLQSATIMKADFTGAGNTLRLKINSGPFNVIPNTGSSSTIALSVGTNIAILRVTSTASVTPEDYTFTLTRAAPNSALIPTLGTPTVSSTGFTVQITNYDNLFTWSATATAGGSVAISNTGLITVTGLSPSTTSVLAVTSLRAGYANGRTTLSQSTSSS